jgi:hypothetical protein
MAVTNTYRKTVTHTHNGVPATATVTAVEQHGNIAMIVAVDSDNAYVTNLYTLTANLEGIDPGTVGVILYRDVLDLDEGGVIGTNPGYNLAAGEKAVRAAMAFIGRRAVQYAVETM